MDVLTLHQLPKEPHVQVRYGLEVKAFEGLEKGKFRFLDSPIETTFRARLEFGVGQVQKKLFAADAGLFCLTKENFQVASHSRKIQGFQIGLQFHQSTRPHSAPPSCP